MSDNWKQKRQRKVMFWVILVALLLGAGMVALMLFENSRNSGH